MEHPKQELEGQLAALRERIEALAVEYQAIEAEYRTLEQEEAQIEARRRQIAELRAALLMQAGRIALAGYDSRSTPPVVTHIEIFRAGEDPKGGGRYFERRVEGPEINRAPCRQCTLCIERRRAAQQAAALVSAESTAV